MKADKKGLEGARAPDPSGAESVFKGVNGQLYVFPNKVTIKRKGFLAKSTQGFFTGDKDIYFHQIGSINVKQGGNLTNGFITFAPLGNLEHSAGCRSRRTTKIRSYFESHKTTRSQRLRPMSKTGCDRNLHLLWLRLLQPLISSTSCENLASLKRLGY